MQMKRNDHTHPHKHQPHAHSLTHTPTRTHTITTTTTTTNHNWHKCTPNTFLSHSTLSQTHTQLTLKVTFRSLYLKLSIKLKRKIYFEMFQFLRYGLFSGHGGPFVGVQSQSMFQRINEFCSLHCLHKRAKCSENKRSLAIRIICWIASINYLGWTADLWKRKTFNFANRIHESSSWWDGSFVASHICFLYEIACPEGMAKWRSQKTKNTHTKKSILHLC